MTVDFGELLRVQTERQFVLEGQHPAELPRDRWCDYIRTNVLGLLDEAHEVLAETGWKPWKKQNYGEVDFDKFVAELSDVLVFVANLAIAVGATEEDVARALAVTYEKNRRRLEEGY